MLFVSFLFSFSHCNSKQFCSHLGICSLFKLLKIKEHQAGPRAGHSGVFAFWLFLALVGQGWAVCFGCLSEGCGPLALWGSRSGLLVLLPWSQTVVPGVRAGVQMERNEQAATGVSWKEAGCDNCMFTKPSLSAFLGCKAQNRTG